jgi:hypothetical protein
MSTLLNGVQMIDAQHGGIAPCVDNVCHALSQNPKQLRRIRCLHLMEIATFSTICR